MVRMRISVKITARSVYNSSKKDKNVCLSANISARAELTGDCDEQVELDDCEGGVVMGSKSFSSRYDYPVLSSVFKFELVS